MLRVVVSSRFHYCYLIAARLPLYALYDLRGSKRYCMHSIEFDSIESNLSGILSRIGRSTVPEVGMNHHPRLARLHAARETFWKCDSQAHDDPPSSIHNRT